MQEKPLALFKSWLKISKFSYSRPLVSHVEMWDYWPLGASVPTSPHVRDVRHWLTYVIHAGRFRPLGGEMAG